jgi:hypothetical protein
MVVMLDIPASHGNSHNKQTGNYYTNNNIYNQVCHSITSREGMEQTLPDKNYNHYAPVFQENGKFYSCSRKCYVKFPTIRAIFSCSENIPERVNYRHPLRSGLAGPKNKQVHLWA